MIPVYAPTLPGLESLAIKEASELISATASVRGAGILFSAELSAVLRFAAHAQSVSRVLLHPTFFNVGSNVEPSISTLKKLNSIALMEPYLAPIERFRVECERFGEHNFRSSEFAAAVGGLVKEKHSCAVDLRSPQASVYCLIDESFGVVGFDPVGMDLGKRYYKVFATPRAPRGPLGYALARAVATPGCVFLDPSCMAGVIPIELAVWASGQSVHRYNKDAFLFVRHPYLKEYAMHAFDMRSEIEIELYAYDGFMPNVSAAKKNAKIAGVQKSIHFGRSEAEWLDVKFKKGEIDAAAMHAPPVHALKQLFYQLEYVMAKKCTVAVSGHADAISRASAEFGFVKRDVFSVGRQTPLDVVVLARGKP